MSESVEERRASKSGINADMQKKLEETYAKAKEDETKAKKWIEEILSESIPEGELIDALTDGSVLCRLLNCLQPCLIPAKYEKPQTQPFSQIDAITQFLKGCKKYGMLSDDLFVALDLHDKSNPNMVLSTIFSLGRQAQKKQYEGPVLGPKEAEAQQREFTEEQLRLGRNTIGLQMGTNQVASQTGMTPYGKQRQIY